MSASAEIVVVGTSMGGMHALSRLLGGLPATFSLPVAIVQHRSRESDDTLTRVLQSKTELRVREAEDHEPLIPGAVYLGPSDYHLLVDGGHLALSTDPPVGYARPSIDVLFESAADCFGPGVVGVLLTGANHDGTRGLERIKRAGGLTLVQEPGSAESRTMPAWAVSQMCADRVLSIEQIAAALAEIAAEYRTAMVRNPRSVAFAKRGGSRSGDADD